MSDFRWRSDPAQPALFERSRRVAGKGEYRTLTFHEIESKTIINRVRGGRLPFEFTINAFRGCSHACRYCFARPTHEYLGFDAGRDFDTQIVVKTNAVELVRAETHPSRWPGAPIAMGTNTDPYQRAEGKYRLTRGIVEVLVERGNAFSILTKSTLALRDADLFREAIAGGLDIAVDFSIGTLDEDVWRSSEPGTPHPAQRMAAVAKLVDAGVPSGVLIAPTLPGLSDAPEQVAKVRRAAVAAGARFVSEIPLRLTGSEREVVLEWLGEHHRDLVPAYRARFPEPAARRRPPPPKRPRDDAQMTLFDR